MNKKVAGIIAAVVVGVAVAGFLGFQYWTRTPRYAVDNIRRAIIHRDPIRFNRFVDIDQVLTRGLDALKKSAPASPAGTDPNEVSGGFVEVLSPFIVAEAKKRVEQWVQTGKWGTTEKKDNDTGLDLAAIAEFEYVGLKSSATDGTGAIATLDFHHSRYDAPLTVEVKLEPGPDRTLMAVEIANLPALVTELSTLEDKWRKNLNQPVRERLDQNITITDLGKRSSGSTFVEDQRYHIDIALKNTGGQPIDSIEGDLTIAPLDRPELVKTVRASFEQMQLAPGQTQTYTFTEPVAALDEADHVIFAADTDRLSISYIVRKLTFADGATLELPH